MYILYVFYDIFSKNLINNGFLWLFDAKYTNNRNVYNKNMSKILEVITFILKVTFLGFGGGNAMNAIIKKEAVTNKKWISEDEFDKLIITTNLIPGPSVVEALVFISIKALGKWKGILVSFISVIPHLVLALGVFLLLNTFVSKKYLLVINIAVIPVIIAVLISFAISYLKSSVKELKVPMTTLISTITILFSLFIPAPWNIPAFVMVGIIIIVIVVNIIKSKGGKK